MAHHIQLFALVHALKLRVKAAFQLHVLLFRLLSEDPALVRALLLVLDEDVVVLEVEAVVVVVVRDGDGQALVVRQQVDLHVGGQLVLPVLAFVLF